MGVVTTGAEGSSTVPDIDVSGTTLHYLDDAREDAPGHVSALERPEVVGAGLEERLAGLRVAA